MKEQKMKKEQKEIIETIEVFKPNLSLQEEILKARANKTSKIYLEIVFSFMYSILDDCMKKESFDPSYNLTLTELEEIAQTQRKTFTNLAGLLNQANNLIIKLPKRENLNKNLTSNLPFLGKSLEDLKTLFFDELINIHKNKDCLNYMTYPLFCKNCMNFHPPINTTIKYLISKLSYEFLLLLTPFLTSTQACLEISQTGLNKLNLLLPVVKIFKTSPETMHLKPFKEKVNHLEYFIKQLSFS